MRAVRPGVLTSTCCVLAALLGAPAADGAVAAGGPPIAARPLSRAPLPRPIDGLIVQLKDAPSHERAQALGSAQAGESRLRAVLARASVAAAQARPTGRAAQRLDFGHALAPDEAERLAARLRAQPEVEWVVPNTRERRLDAPNDPDFLSGAQWWLQAVRGSNQNDIADRLRGVPGFLTAWGLTTGSSAAPVAVLDTGITSHPELAGHLLPGYDFVATVGYANDGTGRDADPSDPGDWVSQADIDANPGLFAGCTVENSSWHGTNIAGLIAAATNDGLGVAAINWSGRVLPVRVAGKCGADVADIVDGMRWAAGLPVAGVPDNPNPARIINISFGSSEPCNAAYQQAIDEIAATKQAIVVAAAGNERGVVTRPASCRGVLGIAAANRDGFKSNYSGFGAPIALMTVGGDPPGDGTSDGLWGPILGDSGLLTIDNEGTTGPGAPGRARVFGTSFSTPLVSGAASLMLSVNPGLTAAQLIDGLKKSARPHVTSTRMPVCSAQDPGRCTCTTATCGAGLLDATQALLYAQNPAAYVPPAQQGANIDSDDVATAVALGPDETPIGPVPAPSGGGGGGGAFGPGWLLALALAVLALARERRRAPS